MNLNIEHRACYEFDMPVTYTIQQLHLTPQDGFGQRVKNWDIRVNGNLQSYADAFGNTTHTLVLDEPHHEVIITAYGEVETGIDLPPNDDLFPIEVYLRDTPLTKPDIRIRNFARLFVPASGKVDEVVLTELMHGITDSVACHRACAATHAGPSEALAAGVGSYQDHAHIFIACCRSLGIPGRYVSGYLFTPEGGKMENHAWADAWLEGTGWHSFDVSNRQRANGIHVRLATGLDDNDACPFKGLSHPAKQSMSSTLLAHSLEQAQQ
ncbi:MAG TPA: transglutaminase family protein [Methylophilaceae bacterium]